MDYGDKLVVQPLLLLLPWQLFTCNFKKVNYLHASSMNRLLQLLCYYNEAIKGGEICGLLMIR